MKSKVGVGFVLVLAFVYGYFRGHKSGVARGRLRGTRETLRSVGFDEEAIWRQTT